MISQTCLILPGRIPTPSKYVRPGTESLRSTAVRACAGSLTSTLFGAVEFAPADADRASEAPAAAKARTARTGANRRGRRRTKRRMTTTLLLLVMETGAKVSNLATRLVWPAGEH